MLPLIEKWNNAFSMTLFKVKRKYVYACSNIQITNQRISDKIQIVPLISTLSVENIIKFVKREFDICSYLPGTKMEFPRRTLVCTIDTWVCHVKCKVNTLVEEQLANFTASRLDGREQKLITK